MSAYRIFVTDYFVSGFIVSALLGAALLLAREFLPDPVSAPGDPGGREGLAAAPCALIAFALAFVPRLLFVDHVIDPSFLFQDESLDSCIDPLRQKLGLPDWGFHLHVHYSISRIVLETVGFDPTALRLFHAFRFSLALALFVYFLHRTFGTSLVLLVGTLLGASFPYLWHSLWAGSIGSGALPSLLVYGLLLRGERVSRAAAVAGGAMAAPSLYLYPGATLAIACFLLCQLLFYRRRWSLVTLALVVGSALASKGLADWIYATPYFGTRLGGGSLSVQALGEALRVTPLDFFYRTTSFNAHNFAGPYFEPVLLWTLALALLHPSRFFWFSLCAFASAVVLVGFTGAVPGARRAMWSLPLLYLGCAHAAFRLARGTPRLAAPIRAAFAASLLLVVARDAVIARYHLPVYGRDTFYPSAVAFLREHAPVEAEVVILENPRHEFLSHPYWCALAYTPGLWPPHRIPTVVPKNAPHPLREVQDYWVLLQPTDTLADVERVFGARQQQFLHPEDPAPDPPDGAPHPSPLRVLRVHPFPTDAERGQPPGVPGGSGGGVLPSFSSSSLE